MTAGYAVSPLNLLAQDTHLEYTLAHPIRAWYLPRPSSSDRIKTSAEHDRAPSHGACDRSRTRCNLDTALAGSPIAIDSRTPALLMYTSGTTGLPKGALFVARQSGPRRRGRGRRACADRGGQVLSSPPLYHVNGQCIATVSPIFAGGSVVLPHRFSVSQWWSLVERYRPTWRSTWCRPSFRICSTDRISRRKRSMPAAASASAARRRRPAAGAAPGVRAALRRFGDRGDGPDRVRVGRVFRSARSRAPQIRHAGIAAGPEARVVAPDGRALERGASGEIQLRGANVMLCYCQANQS